MKTKYHRKAAIRAKIEALEASAQDNKKRPTDWELYELVQNGRMAIQTLLVSRRSPEFERYAKDGIDSLMAAQRELLSRVIEARNGEPHGRVGE